MLLVELCAEYCAENPQIKSAETERLLRGAVTQFGIFLERPAKVADFTAQNLTSFIRHRRKIGRSESTIERESSKLLTLWRYAAMNGLVQPPRIRVEKAQVQTPVCFLRSELRRLFRAAGQYDRMIGGVSGNVYLLALLATIWDTAERIGALSQVERIDFDLSPRWPRRGWITIRKRKRNGKTLVRPLRRSTVRHLRKLLAATDDAKPFDLVDRGTLYGHLNRVLRSAGLPVDRKHKFHCVRRSHASYLKSRGGDAPDSLGHADEKTTRGNYYDPRVVSPKAAIDWLFDPFGPIDRLLAFVGW